MFVNRKLLTLATAGLLFAAGTPVAANGNSDSQQITLSPFIGSTSQLSAKQKSEITSALVNAENISSVVCTGIYRSKSTSSEKSRIQTRAKSACTYARAKAPEAAVSVRSKATSNSSFHGRVILTFVFEPASVTLDSLDVDETWKIAWASVRNAMEQNPAMTPEIKYYIAPSVVESRLIIERDVINRTAKLWSNDFKPENARILYVMQKNSADKAWLLQKVKDLGGLSYMVGDVGKWFDEGCGALASNGDGKLTMIFCLQPQPRTHDLHVVAHEYTHWYQYSQGNIPNNGPNWLTEGGATFYGMTMGYLGRADADKTRFASLTWNLYGEDEYTKKPHGTSMRKALAQTRDEFVEMMVGLEKGQMIGGAQLRYLYGGLASEALVASFGHAKMQEFYQSFKTSSDWRSSFEKVYGLNVKDFYRKLYPYAIASIKKANTQ
jgi:hypothetical protein